MFIWCVICRRCRLVIRPVGDHVCGREWTTSSDALSWRHSFIMQGNGSTHTHTENAWTARCCEWKHTQSPDDTQSTLYGVIVHYVFGSAATSILSIRSSRPLCVCSDRYTPVLRQTEPNQTKLRTESCSMSSLPPLCTICVSVLVENMGKLHV